MKISFTTQKIPTCFRGLPYEAPSQDEEHNDDELTQEEIEIMAKKEAKFQEARKRRIQADKAEAKRRRIMQAMTKI